jgi:hypothetical protein
MDNTLNNGRIDQKNIKFPTNIFIRNFNPSTYSGGLIQLSAQKGLNIRNNPAQHVVGDETTDEHRWAQKRKSVLTRVYPWLSIKGKNPTIGVGCRFKTANRLPLTANRTIADSGMRAVECGIGAYAPQVLPRQNTELTKVCVNLIREK